MKIETVGRGPALVLIHGWAMHAGIFAPLAERLSRCHTLHLVDLPGHGSSRDSDQHLDLDGCAQSLIAALPPAVWLGWSLGALIALHAAALAPARVQALIALCGSPRFVRAADWPHAVEAEVFRSFAAELRLDYARTIDRFLALEAHGSDAMRDELRSLRTQVFARGEPDPRVLVEGLGLLETSDLRAGLAALTMPSLWIAGRRDRLVPWQAMSDAAGLSAHGTFARIEGAGHAPFLSHAGEVAEQIGRFLATSALSEPASRRIDSP